MIEIQELNIILLGKFFQLELVIEYDKIPGVMEQARIPVKVNWDNPNLDEEINNIILKLKSASEALRIIIPKTEKIWNALVSKGLVIADDD